jgi:hypothetical protein
MYGLCICRGLTCVWHQPSGEHKPPACVCDLLAYTFEHIPSYFFYIDLLSSKPAEAGDSSKDGEAAEAAAE